MEIATSIHFEKKISSGTCQTTRPPSLLCAPFGQGSGTIIYSSPSSQVHTFVVVSMAALSWRRQYEEGAIRC